MQTTIHNCVTRSAFVLDHTGRWRAASIRDSSSSSIVNVTFYGDDEKHNSCENISLPSNSLRISWSPPPKPQSLWDLQSTDTQLSTLNDNNIWPQSRPLQAQDSCHATHYSLTIDGKLCASVCIYDEIWVLKRRSLVSSSSSSSTTIVAADGTTWILPPIIPGQQVLSTSSSSSSSPYVCPTNMDPQTTNNDILFLEPVTQSLHYVTALSNGQERIEARKAYCANQQRLANLRIMLTKAMNSNMEAVNFEIQNAGQQQDGKQDWTNLGTFAIERNQIDQELKRIDEELAKPEVLPVPISHASNKIYIQPRIPLILGADMLPNGLVVQVSSLVGHETQVEFNNTPFDRVMTQSVSGTLSISGGLAIISKSVVGGTHPSERHR